MSTKCTKTTKTRFSDEDQANSRLNIIQRKPHKQMPVRAYFCQFCGGWHLTKSALHERPGSIKLESEFSKYIHNPNEEI